MSKIFNHSKALCPDPPIALAAAATSAASATPPPPPNGEDVDAPLAAVPSKNGRRALSPPPSVDDVDDRPKPGREATAVIQSNSPAICTHTKQKQKEPGLREAKQTFRHGNGGVRRPDRESALPPPPPPHSLTLSYLHRVWRRVNPPPAMTLGHDGRPITFQMTSNPVTTCYLVQR